MNIEDHRIHDLSKRHLFLLVLEDGNSKIKVLAKSVLGEGPMPGLQPTTFSLCLHMAERESFGVYSSSYGNTNPIMPASQYPLNFIIAQTLHLLITITLFGLVLQHMDLEGLHIHSVHNIIEIRNTEMHFFRHQSFVTILKMAKWNSHKHSKFTTLS